IPIVAEVLLAVSPLLLMDSLLGLGVLMGIGGLAARVSEILSLCLDRRHLLVGWISLVLLALMVFLFLDGCVAGFDVAYGARWAVSLRDIRELCGCPGDPLSFAGLFDGLWRLGVFSGFWCSCCRVSGFLSFVGEAGCIANAALGIWHLSEEAAVSSLDPLSFTGPFSRVTMFFPMTTVFPLESPHCYDLCLDPVIIADKCGFGALPEFLKFL
ncbi:hypothetical protein U1Q18_044606, partial [Sarracenia purpurea var. burkii]